VLAEAGDALVRVQSLARLIALSCAEADLPARLPELLDIPLTCQRVGESIPRGQKGMPRDKGEEYPTKLSRRSLLLCAHWRPRRRVFGFALIVLLWRAVRWRGCFVEWFRCGGWAAPDRRAPEQPEAPGLVVLTENFQLDSLTPGAERWLTDLPGGERAPDSMPHARLSVAGRALRSATAEAPGEVAFARVLSRTGRWIVLHGAVLQSDGRRRVAVIVEPAHPARISPLLMAAYGLSDREQEVARLVLSGAATGEIAAALHISPHTIQQHLKAIYEKSGVRSRRDLVAKVFFAHYEPRLRDNEQRALDGQPLRGGPAAGPPTRPITGCAS
jgi:DNA-binding CsgD family transcriptional regulator